MLLHFLDINSHLDICKSWVNYLDNKPLLTPYLLKYSRDSEWVKLLLTFYPEVDYRCTINELLISCCEYGHNEIIKFLVNDGADIRIRDYQPFRHACEYGHMETAKYLLSLIDTDKEKKRCIQSCNSCALRWSAYRGHFEVVEWLVNNGANVRVDNYQPFRYACEYGHLETAGYLLSLIDTDKERKRCVQSFNNYALKRSAKGGHLEVVKWLVNNGANIRVDDYEPFQFACKEEQLETAEYLLSLIDTDDEEKKLCVQSDDNYVIIYSASMGHLEVVKWLVNNGADFRVGDYEPFRYACEYGHLEIAKYLLSLIDTDDEERKLCIESGDNYALRWSARYYNPEMVEWLVNNGADIRANDYEALKSAHEQIKDYLFDQLGEEEKQQVIDSLN